MIQLRKNDGSVMPVPDASFVEIVSDTGEIGQVIYSPARGAVMTIEPGTTDAERYAGMFRRFGVRFISAIINRRAA